KRVRAANSGVGKVGSFLLQDAHHIAVWVCDDDVIGNHAVPFIAEAIQPCDCSCDVAHAEGERDMSDGPPPSRLDQLECGVVDSAIETARIAGVIIADELDANRLVERGAPIYVTHEQGQPGQTPFSHSGQSSGVSSTF